MIGQTGWTLSPHCSHHSPQGSYTDNPSCVRNAKYITLVSWKWTWILTNWVRVTHICVGKLTIIGSDNGLSPGRCQAIIWTNAGILLIEPLGTNFSEILIGIQIFSFKKMRLKMSSAKWRPFCLGLNVLKTCAMVYDGILPYIDLSLDISIVIIIEHTCTFQSLSNAVCLMTATW